MSTLIAPKKSHTFRSGKKAGWQREFTAAHRARFAEVAGDLLVRLGYFVNWVQDIYGLAAYRLLSRKLPGVGHAAGTISSGSTNKQPG